MLCVCVGGVGLCMGTLECKGELVLYVWEVLGLCMGTLECKGELVLYV